MPDDGLALGWDSMGPLVADNRRVYTAKDDQVIAADAATGRIVARLKTAYRPDRLAILDHVLVASSWQERERPGFGSWRPKSAVGSLEAFDLVTGAPKWSLPLAVMKFLAADGIV